MSSQANTDKLNADALTSRNVVTVACKLPHGIIIRDHKAVNTKVNVLGGGQRNETVFRPVGHPIRIKGPQVPGPFLRLVEVVGGYAITEGVDGEVFARWLDANKDSLFVVNQMIYGHENGGQVRGWAKERAAVKSNMEPLDVAMKSEAGRMTYSDERLRAQGADLFKSGAADLNVA